VEWRTNSVQMGDGLGRDEVVGLRVDEMWLLGKVD
jgi:hypothetical protein